MQIGLSDGLSDWIVGLDCRLDCGLDCGLDWKLESRIEDGTRSATGSCMGNIAEQLKARTMRFSLDVCALIQHLPSGEPGETVQHQLARAATSVAFNYRAACRGRSHAEYTAKIGLVSEESDESQGWLEFIDAAGLLKSAELKRLLAESSEIAAIMSSSYGTARYNERNKRDKMDKRKKKEAEG